MQTDAGPHWDWEKTDVRHSGSSGDIAKLFKNEGIAHPGVMAKGAPPDEATLAAREIIQNSWDAARELQNDLAADGIEPPPFEIDFVFSEHLGDAKKHLSEALDLSGLSAQLSKVTSLGPNARAAIGLRLTSCLDSIPDSAIPLRTLTIAEHGATGMYGKFDQAQSKLYLALISIGYTMKAEGSGGSYGYGKAGLVGASSTRTVVAYTCFRERADDPGVTRRLIGMTYWGQHQVDGSSFTGFSRFGRFEDGWSQPFENEAADQVAKSLGIKTRNPEALHDLGTTVLLLDPLVEPKELTAAIERNWWPALTDNAFAARVERIDAAGSLEKFEVRPASDPVLKTFIRGYGLAITAQDNSLAHEVSKPLGNAPKDAGSLPLGRLGLVAKLDGWSYAELPTEDPETDDNDPEAEGGPEVEEPTKHSSLIALVRGPRMVVEYFEHNVGRTPFIRGTFVADDAVDDLLRQTEPKAHDAWQVRGVEEGIDSRAPLVAMAVAKKIKASVSEFQKKLRPPPPAPGDINLPIFADLFQKLMTGKGVAPPPPPPKVQRNVSVQFAKQGLQPSGANAVFYDATVKFKLSDTYTAADSAEVTISLDYSFIEDGRKGRSCPSTIAAPAGFTGDGETGFTGVLTREAVVFQITTEPYSPDWTGRITADGRIKPKSKLIGGTDGA